MVEQEQLRTQLTAGMDQLDRVAADLLQENSPKNNTNEGEGSQTQQQQQQSISNAMSLPLSLQRAMDSLQPLLGACRLAVSSSLSADVNFDARLLPYAVRNGLRNAARHARGEVGLLAWREDDGSVCIAVDDDGPGVPVALREAAFEPFRRLEGEREKRSRGYGLGLAIVRRVILAHGGQASLESSPSGGARLLLRWPG